MLTGILGSLFGSIRARVRSELKDHYRTNSVVRQARHGLALRVLRAVTSNRSVVFWLAAYSVLLCIALTAEWWVASRCPCLLPGWLPKENTPFVEVHGFLKDFAGFLLTTQTGILAIVAVAVGIVTLILQDDEGDASFNIDLYYTEAFAFELARSSVALLLVLTVQLFWPFHHLLHYLGAGTTDLVFKVIMTMVHATWLALNLCLFLVFIITSLTFVDDRSRQQLRKRYTASLGAPGEISRTLFDHFYYNAAIDLFGDEGRDKGPVVGFGRSPFVPEEAEVELAARFRVPVMLHDVWMKPLSSVAKSWVKRTRSDASKKPKDNRLWPGTLVFPPDTNVNAEEEQQLALREGGAPLSKWDRWRIKRSFWFSDSTKPARSVVTPTKFMENLVRRLVVSINRGSFGAFRERLNETIDYHRFLLAALNTKDSAGKPLNLGEIGGVWQRPHEKWLHEYRAAFEAAATKIPESTEYAAWLSHLPASLIPTNAADYSANVVRSIVDLGYHQVVKLEAWYTKIAIPPDPQTGSAGGLPPYEKAAYATVLVQVVSSWESLENRILSAFNLRRQRRGNESDQWKSFGQSWPSLDAHIDATAYYVASAVWNEDEQAAERYCDMLLRWLSPFYDFLRNDYQFRNRFLASPDLLDKGWQEARPEFAKLAQYNLGDEPTAATGFGLILRGVYEDVVTITAAVLLSWYAREKQATDVGARFGVWLISGRRMDEGSDLSMSSTETRSVFRIVFDFLVRQALDPQFGGSRYAASLSGLVQRINGVAGKRVVPGRIYSGWGLEDVASLRHTLLAMLAANLPATGDEGARRIVSELLNEGGPLKDPDASRAFAQEFEALLNVIGEQPDAAFLRLLVAFPGDFNPAERHAQVRALLQSIVGSVRADQEAELVAARLDETRMAETRAAITNALLTDGPDIYVLMGFQAERGDKSDPIQSTRFGVIDRGAFTDPPSSSIAFGDYARVIVDVSRQLLARNVWQEFFTRERSSLNVRVREGVRLFWRTVIAAAPRIGKGATILVPFDTIGEGIGMAGHGGPNADLDEFVVVREEGVTGGGGTAYLGTIEGVRVFSADLKPGTAMMFSGNALRRIRYGEVSQDSQIADFDFEDTSNPSESWVRLRFAQTLEWDQSPMIEFIFDRDDWDDGIGKAT